jgi:hypothetical protein
MPRDVPSASDEVGPGDELGLVAPARALRLHGLLQHTLEELNRAPLDEPTRRRLLASQHATMIEAASTVSDALVDEMIRLHMEPLGPEASTAELKVAQAQLLGWLTGLLWTGGLASGASVSADSYVVDVLLPEDESG